MNTFIITVNSKSKKAIDYFCLFFSNSLFISNTVKKCSKKKIKKIKLSLLKSPHVNKKSQEQFEMNFMRKRIAISTKKGMKLLLFLKKLSNSTYSSVYLKIKQILNIKKQSIILHSNFLKMEVQIGRTVKFANFKLKKRLNKSQKIHKLKHLVSKKVRSMLCFFDLTGEPS